MSTGLLVALSLAPAVGILAYYLRLVRFAPEPWPRVLLSVLAGAGAFAIAARVEAAVAPAVGPGAPWLWAFGVVAPVEEGLKLLAMKLGGGRARRYQRVSSGLVYGVAAGAGFACVENLAYVLEFGSGTALVRALTAVPAHALHSAIVGISLGIVGRTEGRGRRRVLAAGLLAAIVLHGVYDGLLLGGGHLRGLVVLVVALEALAVGVWVRRVLAHDLRRDVDRLATVPLLAGAPTAALNRLAGGSVRQRVRRGVTVVRQGRRGDAMFLILRGRLEVRRGGERVATLTRGDFFGEQSVLTGEARTADVVATEESLLLRVQHSLLMRAVVEVDGLADALSRTAQARFGAHVVPGPEALRDHARWELLAEGVAGLADRLQRVDLFASLDPADLEAVAKACVVVNRGPSTRLVVQGRGGPGLCLVLSGTAEVVLRRRVLAELVEGDFFGEINLLTGEAATATVLATSPVELAVLRWVDLEPMLIKNPQVGLHMLRVLATRRVVPTAHSLFKWFEAVAFPLRSAARSWLGPPWSEPAHALAAVYGELRQLPPSAAEALARLASRAPGPPDDQGLWLGGEGTLAGALRAHEEAPTDPWWWRLSDEQLQDAVARCPYVLRFVARRLIWSG